MTHHFAYHSLNLLNANLEGALKQSLLVHVVRWCSDRWHSKAKHDYVWGAGSCYWQYACNFCLESVFINDMLYNV